jgi:DNA uptake protein ComE-like DNA-binding protein
MRFRLLRGLLAIVVLAAPSLSAQVGRREGMLDPNLATEAELAGVPGFTGALARTVVRGRPWLSMIALDSALAASLSADQRARAYQTLFLHLNLNAASRAEILLIPGVGTRMLGEFLEYRPYRGLAEFRREIGKYVDAAELARLEGYVFVPLNLNTASDQDLLTIPGLGPRMLREFREYRPYRAIAEFRREIGKYVDAKEVARLERYVVVQ